MRRLLFESVPLLPWLSVRAPRRARVSYGWADTTGGMAKGMFGPRDVGQGRPVRMRFGYLAAGIVAGADMSG